MPSVAKTGAAAVHQLHKVRCFSRGFLRCNVVSGAVHKSADGRYVSASASSHSSSRASSHGSSYASSAASASTHGSSYSSSSVHVRTSTGSSGKPHEDVVIIT